ncbi:hypothetical protein JTB14_019244 [Gonioctena quinquepunctata]|nr:hypothetical protein JTB14_019244 [Gonioctena quinquepunctata]
MLWYIIHDGSLIIKQQTGVILLDIANDIAMVTIVKDRESLMCTADTAIQRVHNWLKHRVLDPVPEAALLTTGRKLRPF